MESEEHWALPWQSFCLLESGKGWKLSDIPEPFKGFPIAMITAGLMSVAFLGFQGLIK
jgi:Na+-translocating ferredoxin:NAD+ oxidoreductase RnfA subunit